MSVTPTRPNPNPKPMRHNGQPKGGKHVPSNAPGPGPYDCSGAVGSNVTPATGVSAAAVDPVLTAPPVPMANSNSAQWLPPLN
jgi:hypothetical protein